MKKSRERTIIPKSKIQQIVEGQTTSLFQPHNISTVEYDQFYNFLTNPRTKQPLQLDILINFNKSIHRSKKEPVKQVRLAIEVQGKQHYYYVKRYHPDQKAFEYTKYKDDMKFKLAIQNGIILIPIKYTNIKNGFDLKRFLLSKLCKFRQHDQFFKASTQFIIELLKNKTYVPDLERIHAFTSFLSPSNHEDEDNILNYI